MPRRITGKVVEMKSGGMNINGHAQDCDFLGHLPPASSYILVELDMSTTLAQDGTPLVSKATLDHFQKQFNARQKARLTKAAKEKKYNDRVEKTNSKKFAELKEKALGESVYS